MLSGPPGLRAIKGFHDEALAGEWKGHRSSLADPLADPPLLRRNTEADVDFRTGCSVVRTEAWR
jgi:hypothetical protein